jgi:hypothetical protein
LGTITIKATTTRCNQPVIPSSNSNDNFYLSNDDLDLDTTFNLAD